MFWQFFYKIKNHKKSKVVFQEGRICYQTKSISLLAVAGGLEKP